MDSLDLSHHRSTTDVREPRHTKFNTIINGACASYSTRPVLATEAARDFSTVNVIAIIDFTGALVNQVSVVYSQHANCPADLMDGDPGMDRVVS